VSWKRRRAGRRARVPGSGRRALRRARPRPASCGATGSNGLPTLRREAAVLPQLSLLLDHHDGGVARSSRGMCEVLGGGNRAFWALVVQRPCCASTDRPAFAIRRHHVHHSHDYNPFASEALAPRRQTATMHSQLTWMPLGRTALPRGRAGRAYRGPVSPRLRCGGSGGSVITVKVEHRRAAAPA
jgi:hypothetical protein